MKPLDLILDSPESEKQHIILSNFGASLGKKSGRLVVREKGQIVTEVPFDQVEQVTVITSGASLSTDAIEECVRHGIEINLLDFRGTPYAKLFAPGLTATVKTRREQLLAFNDQRSLFLAKSFVRGKIQNQINTLKYFAKYRKSARQEVYAYLQDAAILMEKNLQELTGVDGLNIDAVRGPLMSVEGRAATRYWDAVAFLLKGYVEFPGRENRGATDPVNSLLNYGYAVLEARVLGAVLQAGLDPYAGFLHVDRPGKASLVYDFIEEFRQPVVDRPVLAMAIAGVEIGMEADRLGDGTKRELLERITQRLSASERFDGKKYPLQAILLRQARRMASYLRGDQKYKPFVCGW
ncbi:CRISPR-associated endonuclease Cas1 [Heliobacterium gestii]|uniref:CRISPR-associated endonuclease Cas1 n=1 Tax=Heliomicrobium gestii TaxID=2699 RepID=A0A845L8V0_HELGE|nr:CRISPR-associated endonuclease Cas1 [Heliomicrobium gestii]MBM7865395.1 CRISPR-associated protein Cas1 [Heliomicrobium gestii]MZP41654.1 CRISPR-associated endonuclease Cas1 [Heliomicrobium gestii]